MYRQIVISPMRTSNNVCSAVAAPQFANLKLYQDCYKLTVSLNISKDVYEALCQSNYKPSMYFQYRGRHYIHWERSFGYTTSFGTAYQIAGQAKDELMIIIRRMKVKLLQDEIRQLSLW